ncbi:MAG: hypothetical protein Q7S01_02480 [bacterium]|nr:hypothetical protein [bacterium]
MSPSNAIDSVSHMNQIPEEEVERYLRTGGHDPSFIKWPGDNFVACSQVGTATLRNALISTVRQRAPQATVPEGLVAKDMVAFTRAKVTPMVQGLFPPAEVDIVLGVLARSVVFLTRDTIDIVLGKTPWLGTAWDLANLYLASYGAERLSDSAPEIVGLSEETNCYVSVEYFTREARLDDFIVHEAAHIFHNCKHESIGLPATPRREWLLEIEFAKRETFAYACEAYSRILELGDAPAARRTLLLEIANGRLPADERVDGSEYMDILREAVEARNGWKRILRRCASIPGKRGHSLATG